MSLTIYGMPASRAFRCLWAAHELGLAYESVPYSFLGPETKEPAYLAINPNGSIPAIVDDGFPLFESLAINLYLARKAGKLWPPGLQAEAQVLARGVVTAIAPGPFASDINIHARDQPDAVAAKVPARRIGTDEDMAGAAIFLASRAGDYVVGATLTVDGGVAYAS